MNKKTSIFLIALGLLILGVGAYVVTARSGSGTPNVSSSSTVNSNPEPSKSNQLTSGKVITVTGTMSCLELKNVQTPQPASCAIGMKTNDGKSYALNSEDPTTVGTVPTGAKVRITGNVSETNSRYNVNGIINVIKIERL